MIKDSREAKDIGRFIRARREKTDASTFRDVPGRRRHVPHLTQSDLAELIGVSTVVISQVEQGRYPNLNRHLLREIAQALEFTQQQRLFVMGLFELRPEEQESRQDAPHWLITSINQISHPVLVVNPAYDLAGFNEKAAALLYDMDLKVSPMRNGAVSIFQLPAVRTFIEDWQSYAASLVSGIKMNYATFPAWRDYIDDLIPRIEKSDPLFHQLWIQDDPLVVPTIAKSFHHHKLGKLNLKQILTDVVEVPSLTRIDFSPVDIETRKKLELL